MGGTSKRRTLGMGLQQFNRAKAQLEDGRPDSTDENTPLAPLTPSNMTEKSWRSVVMAELTAKDIEIAEKDTQIVNLEAVVSGLQAQLARLKTKYRRFSQDLNTRNGSLIFQNNLLRSEKRSMTNQKRKAVEWTNQKRATDAGSEQGSCFHVPVPCRCSREAGLPFLRASPNHACLRLCPAGFAKHRFLDGSMQYQCANATANLKMSDWNAHRITLEDLLNPVEEVDTRPQLSEIASLLTRFPAGSILVPPELQVFLQSAIDQLKKISKPPEALRNDVNPTLAVKETLIEHDIVITNKTTLSTLYRYPQDAYIEYPETGEEPVGHLFQLDPNDWRNKVLTLHTHKASRVVGPPRKKTTSSALSLSMGQRLAEERESRLESSSPQRDVFKKTAALIATVQNQGCTRSRSTPTVRTDSDQKEYDEHQNRKDSFGRGRSKPETCEGRIMYRPGAAPCLIQVFLFLFTFEAFVTSIRCEHYSRSNKDHWVDFSVNDGSYNLQYLAAIFANDTETIHEIEEEARQSDYGPLALCSVVCNHSTQRKNCPNEHRDSENKLFQPLLVHLECKCRFHIYEPQKDHLHSSLANRAHLGAYIDQAKKIHFPKGTDWKVGVLQRKEYQDANIDAKDHYIRTILDLNDSTLAVHEEDDLPKASDGKRTRIIICMSPEGSRRLLQAQYIQSDIGFRRIVGFLEFEMACMDRDANTSVIFCRIYLNRQTAAAHQHIFHEIQKLVHLDTGFSLQWRHLHATSLDDWEGLILHWAVDQHRGQAKGLGLHLWDLAQTLDGAMDLHDVTRTLSSLTPYEHLCRILRLCVVHFHRRIKSCNVSEEVRQLMRSLICITHTDWDGTIAKIKQLGGKPAIAGERHSNLIETVHRDVNREGVHCTLLGGVIKGQRFDALKIKTLQEYEAFGIRPSYHPVNLVVNATKSYKRKDKQQSKSLQAADSKIRAYNIKVEGAHAKVNDARTKLHELYAEFERPGADRAMLQTRIDTTMRVQNRAWTVYQEQLEVGRSLVDTGSGQVRPLLP
ncbi:hypothetical protein C8R45DRAFT_940611 [Mycena sanguinolenta]|nr:hypothetical protein C8R45DRAFT_940611 [Mycena sanguinolenta]